MLLNLQFICWNISIFGFIGKAMMKNQHSCAEPPSCVNRPKAPPTTPFALFWHINVGVPKWKSIQCTMYNSSIISLLDCQTSMLRFFRFLKCCVITIQILFFSELRSQNGHGACEEEHGEEQRDGNRRFLPGQTWGRSSCDQRQFIVERSSTFDLKPDSDNGLLRHV